MRSKASYSNECAFGRKFEYWPHCESSPYYVRRKYANLKLEVMDNRFCPLEIGKFIEIHIKANRLLNESNVLKRIRCDGDNQQGLGQDVVLNIQNVMALILYTDFDILTAHLVATYCPVSELETDEQLVNRHREFWNWSKLLLSCVSWKM